MKKNKKRAGKQTMPEFSFKEFTPEEDAIYTEAVNRFRESLAGGKTLRQAYDSFAIQDKELETFIQADFLKIMIAERHFAHRQTLEKVAQDLSVSIELVKDTYGRMLQEVGVSAANQFGQEYGSLNPDVGKTND